jgi:putative glutamine amidotransferase
MVPVVDTDDLRGIKLLVLHGGEDISPELYGQKPVRARAGAVMSRRDAQEKLLVEQCVKDGIPILGICRGAQLLCALDGGTLYQHVDNHGGGSQHEVIIDDKEYRSNSCHHQLMRPASTATVLGYTPARSFEKWTDDDAPVVGDDKETEIVHFPKLNAIGVQGHPEWLSHRHDLNVVTRNLVEKYLNVQLNWR